MALTYELGFSRLLTPVGRMMALAFVLTFSAFRLSAGEVAVLQGGVRIELRKPLERRGDVVLLTRADGVLLSVRAADIDWKATAAARNTTGAPPKEETAVPASQEKPAQAIRGGRDVPKARVKLTDADVAHVTEEELAPGGKETTARARVSELARQRPGGKPMLYDFTAAWCPPCRRLETEGFSDPQIASLINDAYVLARVVDRRREDGKNSPDTDALQGRYSIHAFPTLVVATPDGRPIARLNGYPGRTSLLRFLQQSSGKTP